ncbi:MAG: CYTH domain-containing protein [Selenomonadaceae bacterium]|nr:CYTH domain-containing protein [Selenomonadaceae bacterium]
MEIERQFLVKTLPDLPSEYESLRQGYVALLPEIRIRQISESRFTLTVKRGAGLVREEWETDISRKEFDSLAMRLCPDTAMIEKRRYRIPLVDGNTAELHVHDGYLSGFSYVEVEFPTEQAANSFEPPSWFGHEVTEDVRFSYGTLARKDGMEIVRQILKEQEWKSKDIT